MSATRAFLRGDLAEAERHLADDAVEQLCLVAATRSRVRARTLLSSLERTNGALSFLYAVAGDHEAARNHLSLDGDDLSAQLAVEAVLILHETELVQAARRVIETSPTRHPMLRPAVNVLGELSLLEGDADAAIVELEAGLQLARSNGAVPFIANAASLLASALDMRGGPGDRDRAVVLAAEAQEIWHRCSIV